MWYPNSEKLNTTNDSSIGPLFCYLFYSHPNGKIYHRSYFTPIIMKCLIFGWDIWTIVCVITLMLRQNSSLVRLFGAYSRWFLYEIKTVWYLLTVPTIEILSFNVCISFYEYVKGPWHDFEVHVYLLCKPLWYYKTSSNLAFYCWRKLVFLLRFKIWAFTACVRRLFLYKKNPYVRCLALSWLKFYRLKIRAYLFLSK